MCFTSLGAMKFSSVLDFGSYVSTKTNPKRNKYFQSICY